MLTCLSKFLPTKAILCIVRKPFCTCYD
jgi:hypothetical protein